MENSYYFKDCSANIIELYFFTIPHFSIRSKLKQHFWRYNPEKKCWYASLNSDAESLAISLGALDGTPDQKAHLRGTSFSNVQTGDELKAKFRTFGWETMSKAKLEQMLSTMDGPAPKAVPVSAEYAEQAELFVVTLFSLSGKMILVGITKEVSLQDSDKNIFWIERSISSAIIQGILRQKPWVLYHGEPCLISFYTDSKLLREIVAHSTHFANNPGFAEIWIYSLKMPCVGHQKRVETVTAYVQAANDMHLYPLNVYYCPVCQKYYINSEQYRAFAKKHGLPDIRLMFERNANGTIDFSAWHEESLLHLMGYNVDSREGLSDEERHQTLLHILNTGTMTKAEIISFLEFLIYKNEGNYRLDNARTKWKEDANFIRNYDLGNQRKVAGRFKTIYNFPK